MPLKLFDQLVTQYLTDNTVGSVGMAPSGGQGGGDYNNSDTYAPGDARRPKVLGATITRKGKVKKRRKKKLNESNDVLYHATYKPLLKSIQKNGLGGSGAQTNWEDSKPGVVYLAKDPDVAYSYAETNDVVPDSWLDQIVILTIPINNLNLNKLHNDENVIDDDSTFEYHGIIKNFTINEKSIYDYLLFPPEGEEHKKIVANIAKLQNNPDEAYRGISSAEYKNLKNDGFVVSRGAGNTRKGITGSYVSDDIQLAGRFAFHEYKQKGRAYLLVLDRDKLPELNPADEGNYWTAQIPLDAVKQAINLQDLAK